MDAPTAVRHGRAARQRDATHMRPPLDPDLLPTFLAVVQHGRISAAARAVRLSQPAVTARIHRLERAVGAPLFVRSVRGVEPTAAGQRLAERAREIERLLGTALDELGGPDRADGPLAIGASMTISAHVLPPALARFRARHPRVPIEVRTANTKEVVEAVRSGELPLGLVEGTARAVGVRLESWLDDELVAVMSPSAPFSVRRDEDLLEVPIIWREAGSGSRAVVAAALRRAKLRNGPARLDPVLGSNGAVIGAAGAGLGVAFLSRWSLAPLLASARLRTIPGLSLSIRRSFQWALPAGAVSGSAAAFHRLATQHPPALP
jgi:DNA-binding transcriptional LysR family regulator